MRRLISVSVLHLFVPVNWRGFLHQHDVSLKTCTLLLLLLKNPLSSSKQQCFHSYIYALYYPPKLCKCKCKWPQVPNLWSLGLYCNLQTKPFWGKRNAIWLRMKLWSPPSSRSLSMVINRYGPCLPACVCYRLPGPAGALEDDPEVWSWSSWRGSVWTVPARRNQPAIDPSSSNSNPHPTSCLLQSAA